MAKVKKDVKLGVNVVDNMIKAEQWDKIRKMFDYNKLTAEATRYVLDRVSDTDFMFRAMDNFSFDELFTSFEDYIKSKAGIRLFSTGDSDAAFHWLGDYPDNAGLLSLYEEADTDYERGVIFKSAIYRNRNFRFNENLRSRYTSCFDTILYMTKKEYNEDINEALNYMFVWAFYISQEWIDKAAQLIGEEGAAELVLKRLHMREQYYTSIKSLLDFEVVCRYLEKKNVTPYKEILTILNPFNWGFYGNEKGLAQFADAARALYKRFVQPKVKSNLLDFYQHYNSEKVRTAIFAFETNEEILDKCFLYATKHNGVSSAIHDIINLERRLNGGITITPHMEKTSLLHARGFRELILTKEIRTAADLLALKAEATPFQARLEYFIDNPFVLKNIKLAEFSSQDLQRLKEEDVFGYASFHKYFQNEAVPFEIAMEFKDVLDGRFFTISTARTYTATQCFEIIEMFKNRIDEETLSNMIGFLCNGKSGFTEEQVAKLLSCSNRVSFAEYGDKSKNSNLDLQSILTLL